MTGPQVDVSAQLVPSGLEESSEHGASHGGGSPRLGDGSRWLVESVDLERREATCRLLGGGAYRRFRARAIREVERMPTRTKR
jgi:hypothetical protein